MNDSAKQQFGDPITYPFWEAAQRHQLVIQRCTKCGHYQFYPRPFCLKCEAQSLEWVQAKGEATIYSMTTVRIQVIPELKPPYIVALVELAEGPRLLGNVEGGSPKVGDRVTLAWRERENTPPLPIWKTIKG